jgi:hypothetical protein
MDTVMQGEQMQIVIAEHADGAVTQRFDEFQGLQ